MVASNQARKKERGPDGRTGLGIDRIAILLGARWDETRRDGVGCMGRDRKGHERKGKERKGTLGFNQPAERERERESLQGVSLRGLLIVSEL